METRSPKPDRSGRGFWNLADAFLTCTFADLCTLPTVIILSTGTNYLLAELRCRAMELARHRTGEKAAQGDGAVKIRHAIRAVTCP